MHTEQRLGVTPNRTNPFNLVLNIQGDQQIFSAEKLAEAGRDNPLISEVADGLTEPSGTLTLNLPTPYQQFPVRDLQEYTKEHMDAILTLSKALEQ